MENKPPPCRQGRRVDSADFMLVLQAFRLDWRAYRLKLRAFHLEELLRH